MKPSRRLTTSIQLLLVLCLAVSLILDAFRSPALAAPTTQTGAFQPGDCPFKLPLGLKPGQDVTCGLVTVPEQHGAPNGPTIQLGVVVIKSTDPAPKKDPLFMAQGGPGGSTIEAYAQRLLTDSRLRADRDIVLWDQRGTLHSKPSLYCTEYDEIVNQTVEQDISTEEATKLAEQALAACKKRLAGEGINLSAYNSLENAGDIESLRQALNYNKINLYGVSYGTLLALHYMRMHPDSLRSVILDGVVPPQTNFIINSAQTMNRSFKELFAACQADPACAEAYPDLEKVLYEVVDQLNKEPVRIPLTDSDSKTTYSKAVINGDTFLNGVFQMIYAGSLIPALPRMIYDARDGKFDFFGRIFSLLLFDHTMSYGMYYSTMCAEDADFTPKDQDLSGLPPEIVKVEKDSPQDFLNTCKAWNVQAFGPEVDQPVISDIPTLVLSGRFDPITPPAYAQAVASTLANSYPFIVPTGGHGQAMESACVDGMILAFLSNPNASPDATCLKEKPMVPFYTPATLVDVPGLVPLLNLEGTSGIEFIILLSALLLLSTAILAIPLAWVVLLVRRSSRRRAPTTAPVSAFDNPDLPLADLPQIPQPRAFLERAGGWLAFGAAVTLLIFTIALMVVLVQMISTNDNRLLFGLSNSIRPWLMLVPVYALLVIGMVAAAVLAWPRHWWSIGMRLYYALITLSALAALIVLSTWGLLTAFI